MTVNQKVTGTATSMPAGIAIGWTASVLTTVAGSALVAKLISDEILADTAIGYGAMFILLLSAALGAAISEAKVKRMRLQVCLLSGLVYYGSLLGITALFFGGQYQGMGVTALLVAAGTSLVILLGGRDKKQRKHRKGRRRG